MTKGAAVSRTSAGAELSDALQAVGSATKGKAADTAKKVKARTVEASDSVTSAFDTAARQSWRTRRKTDRRSRVKAAKRRRRAAQAERRAAAAIAPLTESVAQAERRAAAAIAPLTESVANLVSRDELPKKKRKSVKTVAFTLLAAGATLAVIQQLLGRRHTDATSTDSSSAEPGQSVPEQGTATASEVANAATDQAAAVTDIAAEKVSDLSDTVANTTEQAAAKASSPRKRTARSTTKSSGSTAAAGEAPPGDAG
jgi:hypothetical protein